MTDRIYIVNWRNKSESRPDNTGVVGVFSDKEEAERIYDALDAHGDPERDYFLDSYPLNSVVPHSTAQEIITRTQ